MARQRVDGRTALAEVEIPVIVDPCSMPRNPLIVSVDEKTTRRC